MKSLPRSLATLIAAASLLVPRRMRRDWRNEWEAEVAARSDTLDRWGENGPGRADLARRTRGAFADAAWIRIGSLRDGIVLDLRHSLRRLAREPGFVVSVVVLLALGIGATTVIYSLVDGVLVRPLPYPEPDRLVRIHEKNDSRGLDREGASPGNVQHWRDHAGVFDGLASWYESSLILGEAGAAETLVSAQVSNDFFRVLGVDPAIGRTFTAAEVDRSFFSSSNTHIGEDPVVVISHRLWTQRFGSDPGIAGRSIRLDRKGWQVVGVMPAGFAMPGPGTDLWIPWSFAKPRPKDQHYTEAMGLLAPGVTIEAAQARMDALSSEMEQEFPETNSGWSTTLVPVMDEVVGSSRPVLLSLLGAVASVLLIVCLNIAGLQLVRAAAGRGDVAVRVALGASRFRLVRQQIIESLVLAAAGGAIGVLISAWTIAALRSASIGGIPRLQNVTVDGGVLLFAIAVTLLTGIVFGITPALIGSRADPGVTIRDVDHRASGAGSRQGPRRLLVVAEVALAVILLASAGLLVRSFLRLTAVDPGFRAEGVLVFPISLDGVAYSRGSGAYYERLVEALAALPGVESAGGATALPLSPVGPDFFRPVWRPGRKVDGEQHQADVRMVTPGYFRTLRISLKSGRAFDARDTRDAQRVVIVNETLARQHWPEEDPVGQDLVIDYSSAGTYPYRVVGVAADVRFRGPRSLPRPELFLPHSQRAYLFMNMAVRTSGDPEALAGTIRRAVLAIDPEQPVHSVTPLERLLGESTAHERFSAIVMAAFAGSALILAAVGLYGLLSYQVTRRAREIGIRMALGATSAEVSRMVLAEGLPIILSGVAIGGAAALGLTRLLESQLFGVHPNDPAILLLVAAVLLGAGLLASVIPARRASRLDPMRVLRHT